MKTITIVAAITCAGAGIACAQEPGAPDSAGKKAAASAAEAAAGPEQTAIAKMDQAYEAAFEKGDAKAIADLFTEDAEFTSENGRAVSGRAAIQEMSRAAFLSNKGAKLDIATDSVRLLAPGVIVQKGSTTVTSKDGETGGSLYTAVLVQKDGAWQYSEIIETPQADIAPREHLSELSWLIGDWQEEDKTSGVTIRSQYDWARGGNFISRNVTVKRGEEVALEGWQVIGWDPLEERIRSWTFNSEGGWSAGVWVRDGQHWLAREEGVTADGDRTTSDTTIAKVSDDRLTWEVFNRTLNGAPQASLDKIEISRVKGD
jgi:uncharacterized protein (TIGR02246 family)